MSRKSKIEAVIQQDDIAGMNDPEYAERCRVIGENLRTERRARGFSIQEVAGYLGLSTSYVGLLEHGTRSPSLKSFFSMCNLFNVTPNELTDDRNAGPLKVAEPSLKRRPKRNHIDAITSLLKQMDANEQEFVYQMLKNMKELKRSNEEEE